MAPPPDSRVPDSAGSSPRPRAGDSTAFPPASAEPDKPDNAPPPDRTGGTPADTDETQPGPNGDGEGGDGGDSTPAASPWKPVSDAFVSGLAKVVTAFFTTAGFVVFLGATGAAVTWVRLQSAQLPADRALEVIPIEHFAEVGAVSLAIFVILALIAVVAVYAADPAGRRTDEMRHGLALLVTAEVVVAILLVDAAPGRKRIAVGLCVVVGVLGVVASMLPKKTPDEDPEVQRKEGATRTGWLARRLDWGDALWTRASAKLGPFIATEESVKPSLAEIDAAKERKKRDAGTGEPPTRWRRRLTVLAVFVCGLAALLVTVVFFLLFP